MLVCHGSGHACNCVLNVGVFSGKSCGWLSIWLALPVQLASALTCSVLCSTLWLVTLLAVNFMVSRKVVKSGLELLHSMAVHTHKCMSGEHEPLTLIAKIVSWFIYVHTHQGMKAGLSERLLIDAVACYIDESASDEVRMLVRAPHIFKGRLFAS